MTIDGYYFRTFYISNKRNYIKINLEDRTVVSGESKTSLDVIYRNGCLAAYKNFEIKVIKPNEETYESIANYDGERVNFKVIVTTHNDVYGKVEVELLSLINKQIRNSIKIKTEIQ